MSSRKIAYMGFITSLILIFLFIGTVIRNSSIFIMGFTIFIGALPYIMFNIREGILVYIVSSFLAIILIPDKLYSLIYIFFGWYPLIKLLSDAKLSRAVAYVVKYIWFNIVGIIFYLLFSRLINVSEQISVGYGFILFILLFEALIFIYDYVFSAALAYTHRRILKRLKLF